MKTIFALLLISFAFNLQAKGLKLEVVSEHWPPFIIQNDNNDHQVSGLVTKKIQAILAHTDIDYTISTYPWARSYQLAMTKPNVLIYSIYKTEQRTPHFEWFCPIHGDTPINVYKLKKNNVNISTLPSLRNGLVGVLRSDNSHSYMLNNGFVEGKNLTISSSEESNIKKLLKGRIDAVIQSKEALIYRLKDTGYSIEDFTAGFQLHQSASTEHCMALSKNSSPELVGKLKRAFQNWLKHG
ncbi:MAG: substrate-binding periplasmic protein [Cognaticolwellia sp.]